jgi:uncharacterized membrane protein
MLGAALEIFTKYGGSGAFRASHVIVAVMWMGLLWYFNFVQTPAFAEMEPAARNSAMDKITWRALWWFRWSALATVIFGILLIGVAADSDTHTYDGTYFFKTTSGVTLLLGIVMGFVMAANVWMVIWPQQQVVIANARNLLAGGEADPNAAAAARAGAMASRQNTIFSLPLLVFMVGASHFYNATHFVQDDSKAWIFLIIGLIVIAVMEVNALGKISGRGNTGMNIMYETHKNAMITGFAMIAGFYILAEIILRS